MTVSFKNVLFALPLTGALIIPSAFGADHNPHLCLATLPNVTPTMIAAARATTRIDQDRANFDAANNQACAITAVRANMPRGAEIGVNYNADGPVVEGKYCHEGNVCDILRVAVTSDDTMGVIGATVTSTTMYFKDKGGKSRVIAESSSSDRRSNIAGHFAEYIAETHGLVPVIKGDTSVIGFNPQSNVTQVYGTQSLFNGCKRDATEAYDKAHPIIILGNIDDKPAEYYMDKIEAGQRTFDAGVQRLIRQEIQGVKRTTETQDLKNN